MTSLATRRQGQADISLFRNADVGSGPRDPKCHAFSHNKPFIEDPPNLNTLPGPVFSDCDRTTSTDFFIVCEGKRRVRLGLQPVRAKRFSPSSNPTNAAFISIVPRPQTQN